MIETYLQPLPHGITLSCRAAGARGQPLMLFLHGFPEAAFVWDELLETFAARGFRCVAPNLRGYERSSAPTEVAAYRPRHLVQDIAELIARESPGQALAALVAHDWGGALAWNLANQHPELLERLVILNAPHPGAFLRELQRNPDQQASSAYMNFLCRSDAEALLAENDFARLWPFFTRMGAAHDPSDPDAPPGAGWLTEARRAQYRAVWQAGLTGALNYYRASPLRPPSETDPAAAAVTLPPEMLRIEVPTLVLWGLADTALPAALLDGLEHWVPHLTLHRLPRATHWLVHEQPERITQHIDDFLAHA